MTDKPMYYAGETVTGRVVAHINSPQRAEAVVVKVTGKEVVHWDEERVETIWEGEGDNRTSRTVYHHHHRHGKQHLVREVIVVSSLNHVLPVGDWQYPFSYPLRADLPGCVKYMRTDRASDPHWHNHGRQLETRAGIVYTFKAAIRNGAMFSKEIRGKQELVMNSFFDLNKLRPAHSENSGTVRLCCCIPRGKVTLTCDFDRAAYAGGDTASIKAVITNDSKSDVRTMKVKLVRCIELNDGAGGRRTLTDVVAQANYPGVPKLTTQSRDLPLSFRGAPGDYLPSTRGRLVAVSYRFSVDCDIAWAPDITSQLPVTLFQPAPTVWGGASVLGAAAPSVAMVPPVPQGGGFAAPMGGGMMVPSTRSMPLMGGGGGAPGQAYGGYGSAMQQQAPPVGGGGGGYVPQQPAAGYAPQPQQPAAGYAPQPQQQQGYPPAQPGYSPQPQPQGYMQPPAGQAYQQPAPQMQYQASGHFGGEQSQYASTNPLAVAGDAYHKAAPAEGPSEPAPAYVAQ